MIYLPAPAGLPVQTARLERCDGTRIVDGCDVPCAPGCVTHYDGNSRDAEEPATPGHAYWAPFATDMLAAPHLLSNTELVQVEDTFAAEGRLIHLYRSTLFFDQDNQEVTTWLVAVTDWSEAGHLVCAFTTETAARRWMASARIGSLEEGAY